MKSFLQQLLTAILIPYLIVNPLPVYAQPVTQIIIDGNTATQLDIQGNVTNVSTTTVEGINAYNSFSKFDVYNGNTVNLLVPDSAVNLLNFVHDQETHIDGILNSYHRGQIGGNVFFANPFGIIVGQQGVVNVGSLTAMTPTPGFMQSLFDGDGNPNSLATQQFIEGNVPINNSGLISVQGEVNAMGTIRLSSGQVLLAGSLQLGLEEPTPIGAESMVQLADLENAGGVEERNGEIYILGTEDVSVTGSLLSEGADGIDGGYINVFAGNDIFLSEDALLSAKGQGFNSSGGEVIVFADRNATISDNATLDVSGGLSGDGGFAEFSAKKTVELAGGILSAGAQNGKEGTILIDPEDLNITFNILRGDGVAPSEGISWTGGDLILEADKTITLAENKVISSRSVGTPSSLASHQTGLSTDDSGDITIKAETIELKTGSEILAFANNGRVSGTVTLEADASAGILGGGAEADIFVNGSTIKAGAIVFNASASGDDTLGIIAVGTVSSNIAIDSNSTLIADTGNITIKSASEVTAKAEGTPVDLAVDAAVVTVDSNATISVGNSNIDSAGALIIEASNMLDTKAIAKASSSFGNVSGDAAVAVTDLTTVTTVSIKDGTSLAGDSLSISAINSIDATTTADGTTGGANAAGATVAVAVVSATTTASVNDTVEITSVGDTNINATSIEKLTTSVKSTVGGAKENTDSTKAELNKSGREAETSEGGVKVSAALAVSDLNSNTQSLLATNDTNTVTAENISIKAESSRTVSTTADASNTSDDTSTGVGVAVAISVADTTTKAETSASAKLDTDKLSVQAIKGAENSSFTTSSTSGTGATNVGVAGSLAINVINNKSEALIAENSTVTFSPIGGDIELTSDSGIDSSISAKSTQTGDEAKVGIGASVGINIVNDGTTSMVGDNAILIGTDALALSADSSTNSVTDSEAGSAGGIAVTPVVGLTVSNVNTKSRIGSGAELSTTGLISSTASHEGSVTTTTGADAAGGDVAVGASIAITVANDTVTSVTDRDIDAGGAVTFEANSNVASKTVAKASAKGAKEAEDDGSTKDGDKDVNGQIDDQTAFGDTKSGETTDTSDADASTSEGGVSVAAAISVNIGTSTTSATIPTTRTVTSGGELTLKTTNATDASATADGTQVDGGSTDVGIGAAVAINVASVSNRASIEDAAIITAAGITIESKMVTDETSNFNADAISGAGASNVGVAGGLALNVGVSKSEALISSGANVTLTGDGAVSMTSENATENKASAKSIQEGDDAKVGVGASVALNIVSNTTTSEIEDTAILTGAGDVTLSATSSSTVETDAQAGSAGGVSITPVVGLSVSNVNTSSRIGSGAELSTTGLISSTASHEGSVTTTTGADAAGGDVAVGASIAITVANDTVTSVTDRDIDAGGAVTFEANSNVASKTVAKASAKGAKEAEDDGSTKDGDKDVNGQIDDQTAFGDTKSGETTDTSDADASTSEGGVSVAAAISVNIGTSTTSATIPTTRTVTSGGELTLKTTNATDASATADGTQVDGGSTDVGIGAAVAINVASVSNRASIEDAAIITAAGITIESKMVTDETSNFNADATSGAGASNVGVAGGLGLNVGNSKSEALISSGANVTLTGDGAVSMTSENATENKASAKSIQEGDDAKVGVGASVALNIVSNTTTSEIEDTAILTGAGDVTLSATSSSTVETDAQAGSAGGVSITPVVGLSVSNVNTSSRIGSGAELSTTGLISSTASHEGSVTTTTGADAAGGKVAVGASIAITVANDTVTSVTDRDIDAGGAVSFEANSNVASKTVAKASAKGAKAADDKGEPTDGDKDVNGQIDDQTAFGDSKSGETTDKKGADASTKEGGVSVAAAISVNIGTSTTSATIPTTRTVTSGGELTLRTTNATDASATADGTQSSDDAKVGVGAAVALNVANVTNRAAIEEDAIVAAAGATIESKMVSDATSDFNADATSGAGSGNVGVAGSLGINVANTNNEAVIVTGADVTITGDNDITLTSENKTDSIAKATSLQEGSGGKVGVGASIAVNTAVNNTRAEIEDTAKLTDGGSLTISATSEHDMTTYAKAGSAGGVAVTPVAAVGIGFNDSVARLGSGDTVSLSGETNITASHNGKVTNHAEGLATGSTAVGVAISIAVPQNTVTASLDRGGSIDGNLTLSAASEFSIDTDAEAGAKGASSDKSKNGGSTNELVSGWKGDSTPEGKTTPDAPKAEVEDADDASDSSGTVKSEGSKNKKEIQVAGAIGVSVVSNDVTAIISDGVILSKSGNTSITTTNDVNVTTFATGEAVSDDNGIGVAVALTLLDNDSQSSLGENAKLADAGDVTISSKTTQNMGDDVANKLGTEAKAGASGGEVAVAGSAAIVISNNSSEAFMAANSEITKSGDVVISAEDQTKLSVRAWSGAISKDPKSKAGVGAAFAVLVSNNDTRAYVGDNADILDASSLEVSAETKKVDINDFKLEFDFAERKFKDPGGAEDFSYDDLSPINILSSNNFYTEAAAGAVSTGDSGVGAAGAFSVQVLTNTTEAYIADDAVVNVDTTVDVSAKRDTNSFALGGAFGGSKKVGVGITVTNVNSLDETIAYIGERAEVTTKTDDPDSTISVSADTDQLVGMVAISGAVAAGGGGSGVALNGVVGVAVTSKKTEASIRESAVIKSEGSVTVDANTDDETYMLSGGISAAGKVAVGGSIATHIATDDTIASIGNSANVSAQGTTSVHATADQDAVTAVVSGGVGGKVGVVGTVSVNTILTSTTARIGESAQVNQDAAYDKAGQSVSVIAKDDTTVVGIAGSAAGGGSAGVGAAIDTAVFNKDVIASIESGSSVGADGTVTVKADSNEDVVSITAAIAAGGKAGVGGAVSVVVSTNDTQAYIADDLAGVATNVDAGSGSVNVDANDDLLLVMVAGSGAGGGNAGVGGSFAVSTIINETKAYIGNKADVDAAGTVSVTAGNSEDIITTVVGGAGGGTAGVAATASVNIIKTTTEASIGKEADVDGDSGVTVSAKDDTLLVGTAGAAAGGGSAGVGAGIDTGIIIKNTKAFVDAGSSIDAILGDINLTAESSEKHISTAIGLAGGGSAGVGGAVGVSVMANNTKAYTVTDNTFGAATLNAGDNITISAKDDSLAISTTGAGAGGGAAGVGASLSVVVMSNTTEAYTGTQTSLDAGKMINVKATSQENALTTVVAGAGGGSAGVAGSIGVKVMNTTTLAYLGTGNQVNQNIGTLGVDQDVTIEASDTVNTIGLAGAGAGGGAAGVGVGADVTIVRNLTSAYIGDGSTVAVGGDVDVDAQSDKYANSFTAAGAGGGAAGVAGAASVIAIGSLLDGEAKSGLSGEDGSGNSGSTQGFADEQISGSSVGDMLGDSDQSLETKALLDEETAKLSVSSDFDETSEIALNNTQAFIGAQATVAAGENIDITAEDKTTVILGTGAGAGGGAAGVAGALGVTLIHDSAEAFIAKGATTTSGKATNVNSATKEDLYILGITGSGAGAAAVNGAAIVTVVKSDSTAYIAGLDQENPSNKNSTTGEDVIIVADSETNILSVGGAGGGAGVAGVGGVVDVTVLAKTTKAYIGKEADVNATRNVIVKAESEEQIVSGTLAIFGAGVASVNGVASTRVVSNTTEAFIDDDSNVDANGNIALSATDDSLLLAFTGTGSGAGAAGVTGVVNVNVVSNDTRAYIADNATVNANGVGSGIEVYNGELDETATSLKTGAWLTRTTDLDDDGVADGATVDTHPDVDADGVADGDTSNGANFTIKSKGEGGSVDDSDNRDIAGIGIGQKKTSAVSGLSITALSNEKISTIAVAVAGAGAAAVAGAATVNVISTETEASIGTGSTINETKGGAGQGVVLNATDNTELLQVGGTISGAGAAAVSGVTNTGIVTKTTTASVANNVTINAGGGVSVEALSTDNVTSISGNFSGAGGGAVGAAVDVVVLASTTTASMGTTNTVDSDDDLVVSAKNDSELTLDSLSGAAAGGVGVSGAVSTSILSNDVIASMGSLSELDVAGQTKVEADSIQKSDTLTVSAAGGGIAGVAGAVAVKVVTGTTSATMGANVQVNQGAAADDADQRIDVIAKDTIVLDGQAGSAAVGAVGVGASADVNIVRKTVTASVGNGSLLKAEQDINIDAIADKNVDSETLSAAGGLSVGVGGATSVIVIGAALDSDSQDSLKDSEGSGNNTASHTDSEIKQDNVTDDMGDSEHIVNTKADIKSRTAGLNVSDDMNAITANDKTLAYVGTGVTIDAGRNANVKATDYTTATSRTGGVAVGAVGVGGAVGVTTIANNTEATIDNGAVLDATNSLNVTASNTQKSGQDTTVNAFGGAAGLVGVGAAVAYIDTDNSAIARVGRDTDPTGVTISNTGTVNITASQDDDINADAVGAAVGAGAVGASLSRAGREGTVIASLGKAANVGDSDPSATSDVGSLNISASSSGATKAKTKAGAAGTAFAGSGAFAFAEDDSTVTAQTGVAANIGLTGDMAVTATSKSSVSAESIGVSVAGGVKIGASVAEAESDQTVKASIGIGNIITANNLTVAATSGLPSSGYSAKSNVVGAGGGLLLGLNATEGKAESLIDVDSEVGDSSTLTIGNNLTVNAINSSKQQTDVTGINGGIIAAGFNEANANSTSTVNATIGNSVTIKGGNLILNADGTDNNYANSVAGSGGLVSGSASEATTNTNSSTVAAIGNGSIARTIDVNSINIDARHTSVFNSKVDSTNASLVGASGATARNYNTSTVAANLGSDLDIKTDSLDVDAQNITSKSSIWAVTSGSGGVLDFPAASSRSYITNDTEVNVGNETDIVQTGDKDAPGIFEIDALNYVTAKDKVKMNAGGAISVAKGVSTINADTNNAAVNVGQGALLESIGDLKIGTRSVSNIETKVAVDVWGLAGSPLGSTTSSFESNNQVNIGEGAELFAWNDLHLGAGVNSDGVENNIRTKARTDLWNNTVIPINGEPDANAIINTTNTITVANGADVAAVRHAYLTATSGNLSTSGVGLAKDIYREALAAVASAVSNAFGGDDVSFDIHGGSESKTTNNSIDIQEGGTIRVGVHAKLELEIDFDEDAVDGYKTTKKINGELVSDAEGIQIIGIESFSVAEDIRHRISDLEDLISEYKVSDADPADFALAVAAYESEISFLEKKLEELGFIVADPSKPGFGGAIQITEKEIVQDKRNGLILKKGEEETDRTDAETVRDDSIAENTTLSSNNSTLESQNTTLTNNNSTLNGEISILQLQQAALDPADPDFATDYAALQSQIDTKNGTISSNNTTISNNDTTIGTNNTTIANNLVTIDTKNGEIVTLSDSITVLDDRISVIDDGLLANLYDDTLPAGPEVNKLIIGDTKAQLGNINIKTDILKGKGTMKAPGDAEILITNNTNNFIELNNLLIPGNEGGKIYYNNVDVKTNAEINAVNGILTGNQADFATLETSENSPIPQIVITSTYDPLSPDNASKAAADPTYANIAPDIIVAAGASADELTIIKNVRGLVKIDSAAGNIRVEENTTINGAVVEVETRNGDFIQSYTDAFVHVGGDPLTYTQVDDDPGVITKNALEGSGSGIIANGSVLIAARYLNINGIVQSGIPEWGVTISETATAVNPVGGGAMSFADAFYQYAALVAPEEGDQYYEINGTSVAGLGSDFREIKVLYNAKENRLELAGVEVKGGYIELFGEMMNTNGPDQTGSGQLKVLDGYGQIKVDNKTDQQLYLATLDAGRGVKGEINITNVIGQDSSGNLVLQKTQFIRGKKTVTTLNADGSVLSSIVLDRLGNPRSDEFNPVTGTRYVMTKGTDATTTSFYRYVQEGWFGFKSLSFTGNQLDDLRIAGPVKLNDPMSQGEYLRNYGSNSTHLLTSSETKLTNYSRIDGRSWSECNFLCITSDYYQEFKIIVGTKTVDTWAVKADYPIGIEYIGYDEATIDVKSGGNVLLAGSLYNRKGDTTVTSTLGSILQTEGFASVSGQNINLTAAGSIGDSDQSLIISKLDGGLLNATAGTGDVRINQLAGDMNIDLVSAINGEVVLETDGDLTTDSSTSLIEGQRIDLTSRSGGIGSSGNRLKLETGSTTDPLQFANFGLEALARDDVYINNAGGDLMIVSVESQTGDVDIMTEGKIIDNNLFERVDEDAEAALVALWDEMRLSGTLAEDKANEEVALMENSVTSEYQRYWSLRSLQDDPSSYDPTYEYVLTVDQTDLLRDQFAAQGKTGADIDAAVTKYTEDRTTEYHTLNDRLYDSSSEGAVQGFVPTEYIEGFAYEATLDEQTARKDGSSWSDLQLKLSVSPGLLKEITDTVAVIKEPNVKGKNVTLTAADGIGIIDPLDIDLTKGLDALTNAEKAAIAAAERGDAVVIEDVILDGENTIQGLLQIAQRKPVNIEHQVSGALNASSTAGGVYLGSEENVRLGLIQTPGEIRVKVSGSLSSATPGIVNVIGDRVILEGAHGGIGSVDAPLLVNLGIGTALTARAAGDIYLTELDGNMNVDTMFSKEDIYLIADGSILDAFNSTEMNVRADSVSLTAGGSVGEDDEALDVLNGLEGEITATSGAGEGINLNVPSAFGTFGDINSGGVATLSAANGFELKGAVSAPGDITLSAGDRVDVTSSGSVSGLLGDLQVRGTQLQIFDGGVLDAGIGRVIINTTGDAIVTGITTDNDTDEAVTITAAGRVLDGGDTRQDITALGANAVVDINATGGVGNGTVSDDGISDTPNALEVNVSKIGEIVSDEAINLVGLNGLVIDTVSSANGSIDLETLNGDTVLGDVNAGEDVTVVTNNGNLTIDTVDSTTGAVNLDTTDGNATVNSVAAETGVNIATTNGNFVGTSIVSNGSVDVTTTTGNTTLTDVSANDELAVVTTTGNLIAGTLASATGAVTIETTDGDATLTSVSGETAVKVKTTTGNFIATTLVSNGSLDIETIDGSATLRDTTAKDDLNIVTRNGNLIADTTTSTAGSVTIETTDGDATLTSVSGETAVKVKTTTGNLVATTLISNGSLGIETTDGSATLGDTTATDDLNIVTTNGSLIADTTTSITGAVTIETTDGDATLTSVSGETAVNVKTTTGNLVATTLVSKGSLDIETTDGDATLGDTTATDDLNIVTTNGNLVAENTTSTAGTVTIETTDGDATLTSVSGETAVKVKTTTGNLVATTLVSKGSLDIETTDGDATLGDTTATDDLKIVTTNGNLVAENTTSTTGAVTIETSDGDATLTSVSGETAVKVKTTTGNLVATTLISNGSLDIETSDGDATLGDTTAADDLKIVTRNGNLVAENATSTTGAVTIETTDGDATLTSVSGETAVKVKTTMGSLVATTLISNGSLDIETSDGDATLGDTTAKDDLNIVTTNGNLVAENTTSTTGAVTIETSNGDATLTSVSGETAVKVKTTMGSLIATTLISNGSLDIETSDGNATLGDTTVTDDLKIVTTNGNLVAENTTSTAGAVTIETSDGDATLTSVSAETAVRLTTTTGSLIATTIESNGTIDIETTDGATTLGDTTSAKQLKVVTTNGNLTADNTTSTNGLVALKTVNGDTNLGVVFADVAVSVSTEGGNITADQIESSVVSLFVSTEGKKLDVGTVVVGNNLNVKADVINLPNVVHNPSNKPLRISISGNDGGMSDELNMVTHSTGNVIYDTLKSRNFDLEFSNDNIFFKGMEVGDKAEIKTPLHHVVIDNRGPILYPFSTAQIAEVKPFDLLLIGERQIFTNAKIVFYNPYYLVNGFSIDNSLTRLDNTRRVIPENTSRSLQQSSLFVDETQVGEDETVEGNDEFDFISYDSELLINDEDEVDSADDLIESTDGENTPLDNE